MDVSNDVSLLTEYNQWVTNRRASTTDTTPEEFMRDRLKEVAFDRVDGALRYLNQCGFLRMEPDKNRLRAILEGTYNDDDEETVESTESSIGTTSEALRQGIPPTVPEVADTFPTD